MSDFNPSPIQEKAIKQRKKDCLVSAGAGSGKTAVLSQRVLYLVKEENAEISRFLILTFSKASADDMKQKIREVFVKNKMIDIANQVDSAHIETYDSFTQFVVRKYSSSLEVSPSFSVLSESFLKVLTRKLLDKILDEYFSNNDPLLLEFINTYCLKNDKLLKELVLNFLNNANLKIDKEKYLNTYIDEFYSAEKINSIILDKYNFDMSRLMDIKKYIDDLYDCLDKEELMNIINNLLTAKSSDELYELIKNVSFSKVTNKKTDGVVDHEAYKKQREKIKKEIRKLAGDDYFGSKQEIIDNYQFTKKYVSLLVDITIKLDKEISMYKASHDAYSFSDIAILALKALQKNNISTEMKESFDYIMVDEYQDTSDIQEAILKQLEKNNLYMVGDIKQSIYGFRNSNCSIFLDKYNNYKLGQGGEEIDMNTSYRSRNEIVNIVNSLFKTLMDKSHNPIDYSNGHDFGYGNTLYDINKDERLRYGLNIAKYSLEEDEEAEKKEAIEIAKDILRKVNNVEVFDKDIELKDKKNPQPKEKMRKAKFSDFAIIIDRGKDIFDVYRDVFKEYGIPLLIRRDEEINDSQISYAIKNLLVLYSRVIDPSFNVDDIKHSFVSIARGFLYQLKDEEIYKLVLNENDIKDHEIISNVLEVIKQTRGYSLENILFELYRKFDIYGKVSVLGDYTNNVHKIDFFLEEAKGLDALGLDINDFVQYLEDLNGYKIIIPFGGVIQTEDAVTLITIHKSKGLEYPICYFPYFYKNFTFNMNKQTSFVYDRYGVVLPEINREKNTSLIGYLSKYYEKKEIREERLRLLYVAITRTREQAIVLLNADKHEENKLFNDCFSFQSFMEYAGLYKSFEYTFPIDFIDQKPDKNIPLDDKHTSYDDLIGKINPTYNEIKISKASKSRDDETSDALLELGETIHYLLEIVDYRTKDTSFIKDKQMRHYVNNVINSSLFKGVKADQILHEYSFSDGVNKANGIIDCLIVLDDEVKIIDFKLKHIDDIDYDKQLNTYYNYVKQITDKKISLYLISAITGEIRNVERIE